MPKGHTNNPNGRPIGSKNAKTEQWESLANSITGEQADHFSKYMNNLWSDEGKSDDQKIKDKAIAADLYLKTVEYFKPKQARVESKIVDDSQLTIRIIKS